MVQKMKLFIAGLTLKKEAAGVALQSPDELTHGRSHLSLSRCMRRSAGNWTFKDLIQEVLSVETPCFHPYFQKVLQCMLIKMYISHNSLVFSRGLPRKSTSKFKHGPCRDK